MALLTYCGHSCFTLESRGSRLIFDPFLTGNPMASCSIDQVPKLSAILVSHGHGDHLGDAIDLSKRDGAPVVGTFELASFCQQQGTEAVAMNIGGRFDFGWCAVKLVPAWHSSSFQTDQGFVYTGMPTGIVVFLEGRVLYHLGDTALFAELGFIARHNGPIDVALIPIGGHFTMGIEDACEAWNLIRPRIAVPMHYNTFPPIEQDPKQFSDGVTNLGGKVAILKPGEVLEF